MSCRRWAIASLLGLMACSATAHAQDPEGTLAHVVFSSRVDAHLAQPVCRGARTVEPGVFAPHAAQLEAMTRDTSNPQPLLLDTGGMLAPHGPVRYAAHHAPDALAQLFRALGYDALAVGLADLAGGHEALIQTALALRAREIPLLADNLHCKPGAMALCDVLVDARDGVSMHVQGSQRVAFIAVLPQKALDALPRDRSRSFWIEPPAEALARKTRLARARGADVVIASLDDGAGVRSEVAVLQLAQELPDDAHPDVLLAADAGQDLLFARPMSVTPAIAAGPPGGLADVLVRNLSLGNAHDVLTRPLHPQDQRSRALDAFVAAIGPGYCQAWGGTLPGGVLGRPMDREDMHELVAGAVREASGAEVAVLSRTLVDPHWDGVVDHLSLGDIYTAQRYADRVYTARVDAAWLEQLVRALPPGDDPEGLFVLGARLGGEDADFAPLVAGRPLDPEARYTVAVTRRALASDRLPAGPSWKRADGMTTRGAVRDLLATERSVDPRDALSDPADDVVWTFRTNVDGTFSGATAFNPASYNAAQLTTQENVTLGIQSLVYADADHPHWGLSNVGTARYQVTRTAGDVSDTAEGTDLASLQSTLEYRSWRKAAPYPFVPAPFVQTYLESEFTVPEDRQWRHMLLRPTSGLRFTLTEALSFKLAAGLETQLMSPDSELSPGAGAEIVLQPWTLLREGARKVQLDGDLNYFVARVAGENVQTVRGRFNASFDLAGPFALTLGMNLFAQRENGRQWGLATITSAGLRIQWHKRTL